MRFCHSKRERMRDKSHIFIQLCHLSSFAREIPDDSLMAMPLQSYSFFLYKKYLNVFERYAFSGCWLVTLPVSGAELLFP